MSSSLLCRSRFLSSSLRSLPSFSSLSSPSPSPSFSSLSSPYSSFFFSCRSFATLSEYNHYRSLYPSLPLIPRTTVPPIITESSISEGDREKEKKIYSSYGKGKYAQKKAEYHYKKHRENAKKLGLKTPEILIDEIKQSEKKEKKQKKYRVGRNPPYGTQAKIVLDYITKNQPVYRKHLQEIFVGKKFSIEDPFINNLLTDLNQYRRCTIDELTIKNNTHIGHILLLLKRMKKIYSKPVNSPMVKGIIDQYRQQNNQQSPPIKKPDDLRQYLIVVRHYQKEKELEAQHVVDAREKERAEKQLLIDAQKKRAEINKIKRDAEKELRSTHQAANRVRKEEKLIICKEKQEEIEGLPKRRPGEARLSMDEVKKRYSIEQEQKKKVEEEQKKAEEEAKKRAEKIKEEVTL